MRLQDVMARHFASPRRCPAQIGSVSKKLHLMDKPARPGPPVVLLDRCRVAVAAQEGGTVGIVAEGNHGAHNDSGSPQGTTTPEFASRTSRSAEAAEW